MSLKGHRIRSVEPDSIAWEMGVEPGMYLVSVNGHPLEDVFDYRYFMAEEEVQVLIREESGEETLLEIEKDAEEDFGVEFESSLMDDYRSCSNRCIFCFIDQMPPGMRQTLYFKDDDSRLSFLQGNYVTLTNMSDRDIERIIRYRLEPINISVHTTNPALRVRMLHNRFAGDVFPKIAALRDAHIVMNGQIVLCRGFNDGAELDRTVSDLMEYLPEMQSVSVVPVGLTRFREGLEKLEPFTKEDACRLIDQIEGWQERIWEMTSERSVTQDGKHRDAPVEWTPTHFIHASDEWYLLAGRELPEEERYDGYLQLENGVGMLRLLHTETGDSIGEHLPEKEKIPPRNTLIATGFLAADAIRTEVSRTEAAFPQIRAAVLPVKNDFFGPLITVSGLVTGGDLIRQVRAYLAESQELPDELLIPVNMLRSGEKVLLDDVTVADVMRETGLPVRAVGSEGEEFVRALLGLPPKEDKERQIYEQTDCSDCGQTECGEIDPL